MDEGAKLRIESDNRKDVEQYDRARLTFLEDVVQVSHGFQLCVCGYSAGTGLGDFVA